MAANLLASVHFFCCSRCIRGLLIMLFSVDERGHLRERNQLQTTFIFICQGRRTVLCPLARHIYPCLSTGSTQNARPDISEKLLTGR